METNAPAINNPRSMAIGRGAGWLIEGFGYFTKSPLVWIGIMILFFIISFVGMLIPFIGSLAINILMPVFIAGLIVGCQALSNGQELTVNHLFSGFSKNTVQLILLGVFYLLGTIVLSIIVVIIAFLLFGGMAVLEDLQSGNQEIIMQNIKVFALIALIAAALYVPILMAIWFAPALVILADVTPVTAMKLSFMGCLVNILPFTLYGIVALFLSIIATIPLGLGLLVLTPMILASIYIAYKEIYNTT